MKTTVPIDRSQLESIFATLSFDDMTWAIKNLADRVVLSIPRAEQQKKGNVAFSGTAAECRRHLESLRVKSGEPVPADIDDFGILAKKYV